MSDDQTGTAATGYLAHGFPPELRGRVVSGNLYILPEGPRFQSQEHSVTLPFAGLKLRAGGHNNEQIFFEHPDFPGWSIYSSAAALHQNPILGGHSGFKSISRRIEKSQKGIPTPVILLLFFVALFFVGVVLLFMQKDRIVEFVVDRIPQNWEEQWGDQVFETIKAQGTVLEDSLWQAEVEKITSRLLPVVEGSGYNFHFHIMEDTNVNAFAIPGGHVVILTGLLESAGSAEEVAGVLAHELGHVTERHSMRQIVQSAGLLVLVQAMFGDASGVAAILTEGSRFLLQQKFSRNFEREADDKGWEYLIAAEIDPRGMTRFFEKLKAIYEGSAGSSMDSTMALLNTHPTTDERISRLEEKWENAPKKSGFVEFDEWKKP